MMTRSTLGFASTLLASSALIDGASVEVDGQAVNSWSPIGGTGFSVGHVKLSNAGDGTHSVEADQKVGISVYGVQSAGSYWFPGGLDLNLIPQ